MKMDENEELMKLEILVSRKSYEKFIEDYEKEKYYEFSNMSRGMFDFLLDYMDVIEVRAKKATVIKNTPQLYVSEHGNSNGTCKRGWKDNQLLEKEEGE